jgi:FAD/FMN-containing dehydrogenase
MAADRAGFLAQLQAIVGKRALVTATRDMAPSLTDWRGIFHGQAVAIVRPASTEEVAAVVGLCASQGVAITPQGGNTGLAGGATPQDTPGGIVLALDRMNRVRDLNTVDNVLVAEAGCILQSLQDRAEQAGRLLPLSFAAEGSAQIGGAVSTNAGGLNVLRYGTARPLLLGLEVVLPDGSVLERLGRLRKDNAGYDLKQLFIGAEGTLGIVTAVSLKLFPRPVSTGTAVVQVQSPAAAVALYVRLNAEIGEFLTSFELISKQAVDLSLAHFHASDWPFPGGWSVLLEATTACSDIDLAGLIEAALGRALHEGCAQNAVIAQNVAQAQRFWALREGITEGERAAGRSVKHDVSTPLSRIPALIAAVESELPVRFPGVRTIIFGHVGDGNMHVNVLLARSEHRDLAAQINLLVHDLVVAEHGSITAEHGIGQYRVDELYRVKSRTDITLMERLKHALDPAGLMNPGKLLKTTHG